MYSICVVLFALVSFCGGIIVTPQTSEFHLNFTYHGYHEVTRALQQFVSYFPSLATMYSIGKTVRNKDIWVLKITSPQSGVLGTPNIKFVGNIHGNEPVGKELILHLAEHLLTHYGIDEEVKWLLDKTVIHLLPSMNPDGFESSEEGDCQSGTGRGNGNFVDLNRSFPDFFIDNQIKLQPETEAIMKWMNQIPFVLSGGFHGGTLVANYPFENTPKTEDSREREYSATPDDDTFRYLAEVYAKNHEMMHRGNACKNDPSVFPGGITNGAAWYKITGSMQDYNYIWHGCMELTLEVSCCKYPPEYRLRELWNNNRRAMLQLAKQANKGVRGVVMDAITGHRIPGAILHIIGRGINFTSAETGEFWRILLPGEYTLLVDARGYNPQTFPFAVPDVEENCPEAKWLNVYMKSKEVAGSNPRVSSSTSLSSSIPLLLGFLMCSTSTLLL